MPPNLCTRMKLSSSAGRISNSGSAWLDSATRGSDGAGLSRGQVGVVNPPRLLRDPRVRNTIAASPRQTPAERAPEKLQAATSTDDGVPVPPTSARNPIRPTLSPHHSHAGYLTLSSPLIKTQPQTIDSDDGPAAPKSVADQTADPYITATTDPLDRQQAPADRKLTTVDTFKRAFTLPRKQSAGEADSQKPANSASGGGGLAGLFGGSDRRRSSFTANTDAESTENLVRPSYDDGIDAEARPSTPKAAPSVRPIIVTAPATPPNLVDTPITLVTPPTPTGPRPSSPTSPYKQALNASAEKVAASGASSPATSVDGATQRRRRTGTFTSSKLSTTLNSSPLTPHIEEAKTPGGTLTSPTVPAGSGGFFTSVFTAAQNAANQLTNTINTSIVPNQKTKSPRTEQTGSAGGEEVIPGPKDKSVDEGGPGAKRELAVETLGKGDLSLSHLGISESSEVSPMTSNTNLTETPAQFPPYDQIADDAQKAEQNAAARAVSEAYEKPVQAAVSQATGGRPLSTTSIDGSEVGVQTPSRRQSITQDGVRRTGSIRSRVSDRRHRHRGSSAATGGSTLAAAVAASASALANPGANGPGHRLTGFAVASSKRNKDFHQLFRSVPEDDYLIEDYSAALQRDILLHGRLYISEGHICFSSNILGWVTNLVISFDEVVTVEKKNTAVIFPNAVVIQTLHARNVFASLVARESTYDLIIGIWKISHPNLKSSLNGVVLDNSGTGDKTEKADSLASDDASEEGSEDDVYDEDDEEEEAGSFYEAGGSVAGSEIGDGSVSRKPSAAPVTAGNRDTSAAAKGLDHAETGLPGATAASDSPGPAVHAPTDCGDEGSHYDRPLTDTTIPAPLGKVYNLMWGPASGAFMKRWLVEDQKSRELAYEDDKIGMDDAHREKTYSYIKPLNAPVGPKQTKCITTCTMETFDLEKAIVVNCSTQTPDVPSGNVFTTKTRYCLMWGPGNSTRMIATCTIEWTGKSWLKGPIEKGANDGQIQYVKDIIAALRTALIVKVTSKGGAVRSKGKGRRRKDTLDPAGSVPVVAAAKAEAEASWGLFEPLRLILEPISSILGPIFTPQVIIGILVVLLAWNWFFSGRGSGVGVAFPKGREARYAAYEEIWRREESELWDWLEDRVGFADGMPVARGGDAEASGRQHVLRSRNAERRIKDEKMEQRQVNDAIRVTEERLAALKDAVKRRKGGA
ncbi:hypothetical protein MBLNU459_g3971t3 [Dothideomycetes sp. NU459]